MKIYRKRTRPITVYTVKFIMKIMISMEKIMMSILKVILVTKMWKYSNILKFIFMPILSIRKFQKMNKMMRPHCCKKQRFCSQNDVCNESRMKNISMVKQKWGWWGMEYE